MITSVAGFPTLPSEVALQGPKPTGVPAKESGFGDTLRNAIDGVEKMQASAEDSVTQLLSGNGQDVHGAMLAVEQADLSFQLMVQVRNKIVNAYQEISRMQF